VRNLSTAFRGVLLMSMAASACLIPTAPAAAETISIADPYPITDQSYSMLAGAWTVSAFGEGRLNNSFMNPAGDVWNLGLYHDFSLNYDLATGTTTWSIDFTGDGDFLDSQETVSLVVAQFVGQTFNYANLYIRGLRSQTTNVNNFTINGTNFGNYSSGTGGSLPTREWWFADTSGLFGNGINITGQLKLASNSLGPIVWVRLGDPEALPVVPVPAAAGLGFLGMGLVGFLRRRKNTAA